MQCCSAKYSCDNCCAGACGCDASCYSGTDISTCIGYTAIVGAVSLLFGDLETQTDVIDLLAHMFITYLVQV